MSQSFRLGGHWKSPSGVIFLLELVAEDEPLDIAALVGRLTSISASSPVGEGEGEAVAAERESLEERRARWKR